MKILELLEVFDNMAFVIIEEEGEVFLMSRNPNVPSVKIFVNGYKYSISNLDGFIRCAAYLRTIEKHKEWLLHGDGQYLLKDLHELKGKTLGCWCNTNQTCHGDILVQLVNDLDKPTLNEFFI